MTSQNTTSTPRKIALATMLATLAATVSWTSASASVRVAAPKAVPIVGMNDPDRIPGSYLVQLRPGIRTGHNAGIVSRLHGGRLDGLYRSLGSFLFAGSMGDAHRLALDPRVERVEADRKVHLTDHQEGKTTDAIRRLRAACPTTSSNSPGCTALTPTAQSAGFLGSGSRIAIIDTGVDSEHPEFAGRLSDAAKCPKGQTIATTGDPTIADDHNGHGTRNAGDAAAGGTNIYGIAPQATIVPVKVALTIGAITCGVNYVAGLNGFNTSDVSTANDVPIVSMSLVWGDSAANTADACSSAAVSGQAICNLYNSLTGKVLIAAAAGNSARNVAGSAPAKWNQTVAVSAECERDHFGDPDGPAADGIASFSNFGASIDFISPGCKVLSPEDGGGYKTTSGTSRSAPYIAGVAALVLEASGGTASAATIKSDMAKGSMCPDTTLAGADGSCSGQGQWVRIGYKALDTKGLDQDGIAEPMPLARNSACEATILC
jgi:subtilisin family serine protease